MAAPHENRATPGRKDYLPSERIFQSGTFDLSGLLYCQGQSTSFRDAADPRCRLDRNPTLQSGPEPARPWPPFWSELLSPRARAGADSPKGGIFAKDRAGRGYYALQLRGRRFGTSGEEFRMGICLRGRHWDGRWGRPIWEVRMRRFMSFASTVVLLVGICTVPAISAETDAVTPVEEFSRQIDQLKNTFAELGKKIEDSAKSIDEMTDVEKARQEIESLRAIVGELLGPVSDNGAVSQLGAKALNHAREKLRTLEQETRFTREEQQYLANEWRKLVGETERATDDLGAARSEFVQLLRVLQTREDFIDELMQIRRAAEAVKAIRQLANDIRAASDALKSLIRAIKQPGV